MVNKILFFLLITIIIVFCIPYIPLILNSISFNWRWPNILPDSLNFRAWEYVYNNQRTYSSILYSVHIAFIVTFINIIVSIPAANVLARFNFKYKNIIKGLLFAPIIVPPYISIMGIHYTFIKLGLTGTMFGVMLSHIIPTLPYMLLSLMVGYKTLSFNLENQAKILGANSTNRFIHIVLPHILPSIIAGSSLTILVSLSQYLITLIIGGGRILTLTILTFPFISGGDSSIGATYVIIFFIVNLLSLFFVEIILRKYYDKTIQINI